jgi:nucleoside-diphosphate-sugar epimerase
MTDEKRVLITGGGGYVGSLLVPKLLARGYQVRVLDLFLYGKDVLSDVAEHPGLELIQGDIRDRDLVRRAVKDCPHLIHLACVSNDPSFELDPTLGKSINLDAFEPLVILAKDGGVKRFIYASSSSVYGVKDEDAVTEELALEPLTDYSRFKADCEDILHRHRAPGFTTLILRPATVCGYSPRLRLDLTVNILTNHAVHNHVIKVFGGQQTRPNIHIEDMSDVYVHSLEWPDAAIDGKVYNVGYENHRIADLAATVRRTVATLLHEDVSIVVTDTNDNRSYRVSSDKIRRELGYAPSHTIEDAVSDLVVAFQAGKVPGAMTADRYYNMKVMKNWIQ